MEVVRMWSLGSTVSEMWAKSEIMNNETMMFCDLICPFATDFNPGERNNDLS